VDEDFLPGHRLRDGRIPQATGAARQARVVIAGAGVGGLSAAWRLQRAGFQDFELLELGEQPGGTARGGTLGGFRHPWGAHYLPVPQRSQRALCAFLKDQKLILGYDDTERAICPMQDLVRAPQERLCAAGFWQEGLWLETGASARDRAEIEHFEALIAPFARASEPRPFRLPLATCTADTDGLDRQTALQWVAAQGLAGDRIRWYLEYATRDDYGCTLDQTSLWAFLHYFAARASPGTGASPPFLSWPEGNQHLVDGLARGLAGRLRTRSMLVQARPNEGGVELQVLDLRRGRCSLVQAEHLILALPQFVVTHVLQDDPHRSDRRSFRYAPWVVANLHLRRAPISRGFPRAWDNVLYGSQSLGYVDAGHQLDRPGQETVWTWYLPVCDPDEGAARRRLLGATFEEWRDLVLVDLRVAHPDIEECLVRLDVKRFGHGMVKPTPGFLFGPERRRAAQAVGDVHFAHCDCAGLPLFEEAHWAGSRAAEEVLTSRGLDFESLL